jgi:hypothetical protein
VTDGCWIGQFVEKKDAKYVFSFMKPTRNDSSVYRASEQGPYLISQDAILKKISMWQDTATGLWSKVEVREDTLVNNSHEEIMKSATSPAVEENPKNDKAEFHKATFNLSK